MGKIEAENFAKERNIIFFETSAKTGFNVEKCFNKLTTNILDKINNNEIDPNEEVNINLILCK